MDRMRWTKPLVLALCALALCWGCALPAAAEPAGGPEADSAESQNGEPGNEPGSEPGDEPGDEPKDPAVPSYTVTLEGGTIDALCSYTVISPAFAGMSLEEGFYPGRLTVEVTGELVIEAGGCLAIGTLSVGGQEIPPVLTGSGRIVVRAGGSLELTGVTLSPEGGLRIVQEDGGSVALTATQAPEGLFQWASPLVYNLDDAPDDLFLEVGTPLTAELLPTSLDTNVQVQGTETQASLALSWDLSAYDGRTDGEWTVQGRFLGADGLAMTSFAPLELTVHWYTPQQLAVTDAVWQGDTVPTARLTVENLPEEADVWGEVSTDGGKTWERWDDEDRFTVVPVEPDGAVCLFVLPDDTPRWFRVAAKDWWEPLYYRSEAFNLQPEGTEEDSGGNRGGSTTPIAPDREPTPPETLPDAVPDAPLLGVTAPEPEEPVSSAAETPMTEPVQAEPPAAEAPAEVAPEAPEEAPEETPAPSEETPEETPTPAEDTPEEPPAPQEESPDTAAEAPVQAASMDAAAAEAQEEPPVRAPLPMAARVGLVAAGAAVCVAAGLAAAGVGPFRKKREHEMIQAVPEHSGAARFVKPSFQNARGGGFIRAGFPGFEPPRLFYAPALGRNR